MLFYVLKHNKNLKVKNLLLLIRNYNIFITNFESILNSPEYILLIFSMKQNELIYFKRFLFYKLKTTNIFLTKNSFLVYKLKIQEKFINRIFSLLLIQLFFYITNLIFSYCFLFIPQKFRTQNFKTQFNKFLKNIKVFKPTIYTFNCSLNFKKSELVKSFVKFLKKLIIDNLFIKFVIFIFLLQSKFFFINEIKKKFSIVSMIFQQVDYLIYSLITTCTANLYKNISSRFKKIFYYIKISLQQIYRIKKLPKWNDSFFNHYKNKKYFINSSLFYFKLSNSYLIVFFGNFRIFNYIIKTFYLFSKIFLSLNIQPTNLKNFQFFGFQYKISKTLETRLNKNYFINSKTNVSKLKLTQYLPSNKININLFTFGILTVNYKPTYLSKLIPLFTENIFNWYFTFFVTFLNYYKKCTNLNKFRLNLFYILKWSLFFTLVKKHKKSLKYVFLKYINHLKIKFQNTFENVYFKKIIKEKTKFLIYIYNYDL